jgi:general secretion pathway protein A
MDFLTPSIINHRLEVAGGKGGVLFSGKALKRIYRYSRGLPRLINVACDRALLVGYTKDTTKIGSRIAAAGIEDVRKNTVPHARRRHLILIPAFFILAALFVAGIYLNGLVTRPIECFPAHRAPEEQTKKPPHREELSPWLLNLGTDGT